MKLEVGHLLVGVSEFNAGLLRLIVAKDDDGWLWDYVDAEFDEASGEWCWRKRGGGNAPYLSSNSTDPHFEMGWQRVPTRRRVLEALAVWRCDCGCGQEVKREPHLLSPSPCSLGLQKRNTGEITSFPHWRRAR